MLSKFAAFPSAPTIVPLSSSNRHPSQIVPSKFFTTWEVPFSNICASRLLAEDHETSSSTAS